MSLFSHTIDLLVVVVAIYAGGAFVCSFVNEKIAALLQLRGKTLYFGLVNLVFNWKDIVDQIYQHPLVWAGSSNSDSRNRPSYIDARNFSMAFWQALQGQLGAQDGEAAANVVTTPEALVADLRARVNAIDATTPGLGGLKQTLGTMLTQAGTDYEKLLTLTDSWFNRQMDRVSGWYARRAQWLVLLFGLLLAVGLNVDSIHLVSTLNADSALSQALSDSIGKEVTAVLPKVSPSASPSPDQILQQEQRDAKAVDAALSRSNDIIGKLLTFTPFGTSTWFIGDLVTALAFALGGAFWFDLLGRLVNVRMAGSKPEPTSTQPTQTTSAQT